MTFKNKEILEAALFASSEPLSLEKLSGLVSIEISDVKKILATLTEEYNVRGVELVKVATGYRFQVQQQYAQHIQKLYEKNPPRYSRALLETLALIAYRQPITRGEIEEVRGVAVSAKIIKTLQEREWVKIVGHRDLPGKPALFSTTKAFLDYFNLSTLNDLPQLDAVSDLDQAEKNLTEQLTLAVVGVKPTDCAHSHQELEELDEGHKISSTSLENNAVQVEASSKDEVALELDEK